MTQAQYEQLRAAVIAYDRALRAYGLLGQSWATSNELDRLWNAVLRAAGIEPEEELTP